MNRFLIVSATLFFIFQFRGHFTKADELSTPRIMLNPQGHTGRINDIHYSPSGKNLITVSEDKSIRIWDVETGKMLHLYYPEIGDGPQGMIYNSALSPDGKLLAFSGYPVGNAAENYILVLDLENGKEMCRAVGHSNVVNSIDFSYDGNFLASGGDDGIVNIWRLSDKKLNKVGQIDLGNRVSGLSFASDNLDLAVAFEDKEARIYNLAGVLTTKKNYPFISLRRHNDPVKYITFSPEGQYLASCDEGDKVVLWDKTGNFVDEINGFKHSVNVLSFSKDGKILVTLDDIDGEGNSYSVPKCNHLTSFHGHDNTVISADFSPQSINGNYQVASTGGSNNEIIIWNAINGREIKKIKGFGTAIWHVHFGKSQDVYFDRNPNEDGQDSTQAYHFDFNVFTLKMQPDDDHAQSATSKKSDKRQTGLYTIQLPGGRVLNNDPQVDGRILDYMLTKEGQLIVSSDFSLKMYDQNLNILKEFVGHTGAVRSVDISSDGRYLISGGEDQTIRLWNLQEKGEFPSIKDIYKEEIYQNFLNAYGLDSIASVHDRKAWLTTIQFLKESKEKAYKGFEDALAEISEPITPLMTLFIAENGQWICYTNDGYFTCSSEGSDYFIWEINHGLDHLAEYFNASQYFDILFRPDLLNESIKTGKRVETLLKEKNERIFDLTKLNHPSAGLFGKPAVAENSDENIHWEKRRYNTSEKKIKLSVDIFDGGGGVKEVNIYQNNKLVILDDSVKIFNKEKVTKTYTVNLVNGENDFKVLVINYQNIESRPDHLFIQYTGELITNSDLYVLAVGINRYKNRAYNLNYARSDASSFVDKIQERSRKIFKNIRVINLFDSMAVKDSIVHKFRAIGYKAQPQDVFVFYYAGHGSIDTENPQAEYYLVPYDVTKIYGDNSQMNDKGIAASELKNLLAQIKCQKQLILLDACHSGSAVATLMVRSAASEEKAIYQLARSAGVVLIAASGTQQFATEFKTLKHGVFTYSLLEGLDGKGGLSEGDGKVTVNELKAYMEDRVPELSKQYGGSAQYPTGFSNGQDFPISVVEEEQGATEE